MARLNQNLKREDDGLMLVKELIPGGEMSPFIDVKEVKDLVFIGKENLLVMADRWQKELEAVVQVIEILDSYSLKKEDKKSVGFNLVNDETLQVVVVIYEKTEVVMKLLVPLKEHHEERKKLLEEKISVLKELAETAKSKPLFPVYRQMEYFLSDSIRLLNKKYFLKPKWVNVKIDVMPSHCQFFGLIGVKDNYYQRCDPFLMSGADLKYLRKDKEFSEMWVNSTRRFLNHKIRHTLTFSLK